MYKFRIAIYPSSTKCLIVLLSTCLAALNPNSRFPRVQPPQASGQLTPDGKKRPSRGRSASTQEPFIPVTTVDVPHTLSGIRIPSCTTHTMYVLLSILLYATSTPLLYSKEASLTPYTSYMPFHFFTACSTKY